MRVAYLTTDDVNPALARRWAAGQVKLTTPRPSGTAPRAAALVVDFDHLGEDLRRPWVNGVLTGAERRPVLVHGHNIPDLIAAALREAGATVVAGCLRRPHLTGWLQWLLPVESAELAA
jgi:hypothetical protein